MRVRVLDARCCATLPLRSVVRKDGGRKKREIRGHDKVFLRVLLGVLTGLDFH